MRGKKRNSMKWKMIGIMLMCWFLPFCLMTGVVAYYILSNQFDNTVKNILEQLSFNNQICMERLNYAVSASRRATYDQTIENAYQSYQRDEENYHRFYMAFTNYLAREYRNEECFSETIFWCYDDPAAMNSSVYNTSVGGGYQQIKDYWNQDHEKVKAYAEGLDTALGFLFLEDRLYMVRNLLDSSYHPIGALIMRINMDYCFAPLSNFPMGESLAIQLNNQRITLHGRMNSQEANQFFNLEEQEGYKKLNNTLYLYDSKEGSCFYQTAVMQVDKKMLQEPFYGYQYVLTGMLLFLFPLLLLLLNVFREHMAKPVGILMRGAAQIEEGNLGYQIDYTPNNLEFQYLLESFNHMSERLKYQFDHIYEEELALRDAKIMALQSHINPHFMNNTLEIINWEARLGNNVKVSKMIEALSTLMDAAIDRRKRPEVLLSEEMVYVDAYLYIISERFGKRLSIGKELAESIMQYKVPRLILQPVIENAVEHGVVPNGTGTVIIRGNAEGDFLFLEIENNGSLTQEAVWKIERLLDPDYDTSKESSGNMGIANVNQRLKILYGSPCGLTIENKEENRIIARLTIAIM